MTYKTRFENIMANYRLSGEKFAEIIGVDIQTVLKWENGIEKPGPAFLVSISKNFNISLDELIKDTSLPERKPVSLIKHDRGHSHSSFVSVQMGKMQIRQNRYLLRYVQQILPHLLIQ